MDRSSLRIEGRALGPAVLATALTLGACGSEAGDVGGGASSGFADRFGSSGNVTGSTSMPCSQDTECGAGGTCNPATRTCACGGTSIKASVVPSNVLVVLDRSCSMTAPSGADGATKWQVAVEALHQFLQNAEQRTRFGLLLFPDTAGEACGQDAITVPISDGAATTMKGLLAAALATSNSLFPAGPCVTNIDAAIAKAATEAALREESRRSFVVLVTDGKQEACNAAGGDSGTLAVIRDLHAAGIDTFVVGFGSGVDKNQLGVWAVEGGQPNSSGTAKYFDAANKTELASAFQTIARRTISCTMGLATKPPADDSASIFVFTGDDEHPLTRDPSHLSGWDYDPKAGAVTLYGDACRALQDGLTDEVHILLGCPGGPPPNAAIR